MTTQKTKQITVSYLIFEKPKLFGCGNKDYTKKNWLTGKHKPVKTLESACAAVNGAFLKRLHKNEPFTPLYDGMNNNISKNECSEGKELGFNKHALLP